MRFTTPLAVALAATTIMATTTPASAVPRNNLLSSPLPPSPVYHARYPSGASAGQLIGAWAARPGEYLTTLPLQQTLRIAFTSRDGQGKPIVATALLTQPLRSAGEHYIGNGNRVWVNSMYINGLSLRCSPSETYRLGEAYNRSMQQIMEGVLGGLGASNLGPEVRGFSVLTPDILGVNMAYGANYQSGRILLDAMRAISSTEKLGYRDPRFVVQGFSGGAMAAMSAAQQMGTYAPEMIGKVHAFFMGGTPVDLVAMSRPYRKNSQQSYLQKGNEQLSIGIGIVVGLSRQYPELAQYLERHLTRHGREIVSEMKNMCLSEMVNYVRQTNIAMSNIVDVNLLNNSVVDKYLERESPALWQLIPPQTNAVHYYIYHGTGDKDVPWEPVKALAQQWSHRGLWVSWGRVPSTNHITAQPVAIGPLLSLGAMELYRSDEFAISPVAWGMYTSRPN